MRKILLTENANIKNLAELLVSAEKYHKDTISIIYLDKEYTYGQLYENALKYSYFLQEKGIKKGDKVVIVLENSIEYFYAFFGILFTGAIVVGTSPKTRVEYVRDIFLDSDAKLMIIGTEFYKLNQKKLSEGFFKADIPIFLLSLITEYCSTISSELSPPELTAASEDIVFYQYTSGTTGFAKGVMISHQAVLANIRAILEKTEVDPDNDVYSSMMPLYHDMGLIGFGLVPLYSGTKLVIYIQNVMCINTWLKGFKTYGVTISGASNTLLNLAVKMIDDALQFDFSKLRLLICGSEPIYPEVVHSFEKKYNVKGKITPAYGLAEISLCATMADLRNELIEDENHIVSCGRALPGIEIIIDAENINQIGEVLIKTPSMMSGYYKRPEETSDAIDGDYLRTGDLGYLDRFGNLFIYGRKKNIIIKDGENLIPSTLEEIIIQYKKVRNAAVIGITNKGMSKEDIYLVVEVSKGLLESAEELKMFHDELRDASIKNCYYQADHIIFVGPGIIPFSPNGKLQHQKLRNLIMTDNLKFTVCQTEMSLKM